jgi:hypothetical protein
MVEYVEDMVCVLPSGDIMGGGATEDFIVCERPPLGVCDRPGGAEPKMLEKAASRW